MGACGTSSALQLGFSKLALLTGKVQARLNTELSCVFSSHIYFVILFRRHYVSIKQVLFQQFPTFFFFNTSFFCHFHPETSAPNKVLAHHDSSVSSGLLHSGRQRKRSHWHVAQKVLEPDVFGSCAAITVVPVVVRDEIWFPDSVLKHHGTGKIRVDSEGSIFL